MRYPPNGLTLIELLVTMAVMSVLSLMSFRALETIALSRDHLLGQALAQRQLALTFAQMESDLQAFRRLSATESRTALQVTTSPQGWTLVVPQAQWTFEHNQLVRRPLQGRGDERVFMTNIVSARLALVLPSREDQPLDANRTWDWPSSSHLAGLSLSLSRVSNGASAPPPETTRIFMLGRASGLRG